MRVTLDGPDGPDGWTLAGSIMGPEVHFISDTSKVKV